MTTQTRKKIIYGAFIGALIWGIYNNPFQSKERYQPPSQTVTADSSSTVSNTISSISMQIRVDEATRKPWGQDPFRPIIKQGGRTTEKRQWLLSGIIYQGREPIAIVNGRSVRVGDEIGDARIIEITKRTVTLDQRGSQKTLTVGRG